MGSATGASGLADEGAIEVDCLEVKAMTVAMELELRRDVRA
jgi:hypothetical protein